MSVDPVPTPPPRATLAVPDETSTFLVIDFDIELHEPGYSVVSAPNENKACELAESAARAAGRVVVDVLTPAYLRAWLDRARHHPPDLRWS